MKPWIFYKWKQNDRNTLHSHSIWNTSRRLDHWLWTSFITKSQLSMFCVKKKQNLRHPHYWRNNSYRVAKSSSRFSQSHYTWGSSGNLISSFLNHSCIGLCGIQSSSFWVMFPHNRIVGHADGSTTSQLNHRAPYKTKSRDSCDTRRDFLVEKFRSSSFEQKQRHSHKTKANFRM